MSKRQCPSELNDYTDGPKKTHHEDQSSEQLLLCIQGPQGRHTVNRPQFNYQEQAGVNNAILYILHLRHPHPHLMNWNRTWREEGGCLLSDLNYWRSDRKICCPPLSNLPKGKLEEKCTPTCRHLIWRFSGFMVWPSRFCIFICLFVINLFPHQWLLLHTWPFRERETLSWLSLPKFMQCFPYIKAF